VNIKFLPSRAFLAGIVGTCLWATVIALIVKPAIELIYGRGPAMSILNFLLHDSLANLSRTTFWFVSAQMSFGMLAILVLTVAVVGIVIGFVGALVPRGISPQS
jgi:hypothetical protein